ncbi:MAG: hypothetical protein WC325_07445 [Candidatus Bathyarchaeia archaeon]|jgi:hypothetical protein
MSSIIKRSALIVAFIAMFVVVTVPILPAHSLESTSEDIMFDFLSSVVGFDLTQYTLVPPSIPGYDFETWADYTAFLETEMPDVADIYPPEFGGLVKAEDLSYDLKYNENQLNVVSTFYNGYLAALKIYSPYQEGYVYSETQPSGILNLTKHILQKYQIFVSQNYDKDTSYVMNMLNVLNKVGDLSPTEITDGNITFQVSKNGDRTRIQWIYTEKNVVMSWKRVDIAFSNNTFESIIDNWGLYGVSGLGDVSSEDAFQIALTASQSCEIRIGSDDTSEIEVVTPPDLSDAPHTINFNMVPFRYQEDNISSKITRDPLTLYPYWQFQFYFNESIGGNAGIQVGVWGDTGEIVYCSGFGYFGNPDTSNDQDTTSLTPPDQSSEENKENYSINPSDLVGILSLVAVSVIILVSVVALRRKRQLDNKDNLIFPFFIYRPYC